MATYFLPAPKSPSAEPYQPPKPGATIQVIGAGLPRTGTNSFCAAVSYLLNGPAYHCGTQAYTSPDEKHILLWTRVLQLITSSPSPSQRKEALDLMRKELDGYVVTSDPPLSNLLAELIELYPNAKVIVTHRPKDSWARSMATVLKYANIQLMGFFFFWVRSLRWWAPLQTRMADLWLQRYGVEMTDYETSCQVWEAHMKMVREVVPKERLFEVPYDAGWGPLCEALGVEVPEGVEYPRLLEQKGLEATFGTWIAQGLGMWGVVLGVVVGVGAVGWGAWTRWM